MKKFKNLYLLFCILNIVFFQNNLAYAKKNNIKTAIQTSKSNSINTIGNYFTFDLLNTRLSYNEFFHFNKSDFNNMYNSYEYGFKNGESPAKSRNNFGLRYGYAVNFYNFFLMPEIYYDHINFYAKYHQGFETDDYLDAKYGYKFLKLNKIYGSKINFGYDLNNFLSIYASLGYNLINYSAASSFTLYDANNPSSLVANNIPVKTIRKNKLTPTHGFGLKFKINQNFNIFTEYQRLDLKTSLLYSANRVRSPRGSYFNAKIVITKIGLSYNF